MIVTTMKNCYPPSEMAQDSQLADSPLLRKIALKNNLDRDKTPFKQKNVHPPLPKTPKALPIGIKYPPTLSQYANSNCGKPLIGHSPKEVNL